MRRLGTTRRVVVAIVATVLIAAGAVALTSGGSSNGGTTSPLLMSTGVELSDRGVQIPGSFLGISTEWPSVEKRTGTPSAGPNRIYDQLIENLTAQGNGPPTLRVGGNFQDAAWWNPTGARSPRGITVNITPSILQGLALNARVTGQRMILGINLAANNPLLAREEAAAILRYVPHNAIIALEIGNEPDLYPTHPFYATQIGGRTIIVPVRGRNWNDAAYIREFNAIAAAIRSLGAPVPLAGPAGYGRLPTAAQFLANEHMTVSLYTQHAYPLSACGANGQPLSPSDPGFPTIATLLGSTGTRATLASELQGLAVARSWHVPMQLTELNSTGCAPPQGLGNSFAAGLWALDQFFQDTAIGLRGVNVHMDNVLETPFAFFGAGAHQVAAVNPLYYAMLMYSRAVGDGGRLLPAPLLREQRPQGANIRTWVVQGREGTLRIVVINKDLSASGTVRVAVEGAVGTGTLIRLDPAVPFGTRATAELGGQWIPRPTHTGRLLGSSRAEVVPQTSGGYSFDLPSLTAAMLTLHASHS